MSAILPIQVLRALAAFMVAVHHVQPDAAVLALQGRGSFSRSDILPWMAGVDVFFVVSGFIMVHASGELFGRPGAAKLFLERRIARIVPLYWAATTLFLLIALVVPAVLNSGAPSLGQVLASYLFWPMLSMQGVVQPVYSLGWTLNYEMLFYVLFAAALLLPGAWVVPAVTTALLALVGSEALAGPLPLPFGFWGQPIVLEFAAGMALALLRRGGLHLASPLRWGIAIGGVALLLSAQHLPLPVGPWRDVIIHGSAASLLVLAGASGRDEGAPSAAMRALAQVGDASYALYLVHPFVIRGLREIFMRTGLHQPTLFIVVALAGAVVAALAAHRLFEVPATRWLRRRLAR